MKSAEFEKYMLAHDIHVFSIGEASKIIGKSKHYTSVFLSRNKNLMHAERGIYYLSGALEYEIASKLVFPSYVSLISALRFHNLTEQMPNIIYILSYKRHRSLKDLNGYGVEFRKIKREMMYGYAKFDNVFVAYPEKAVIDMLYLGDFIEYAEELIESGKFDLKRLILYAKLAKNKSIINKINSMLEMNRIIAKAKM